MKQKSKFKINDMVKAIQNSILHSAGLFNNWSSLISKCRQSPCCAQEDAHNDTYSTNDSMSSWRKQANLCLQSRGKWSSHISLLNSSPSTENKKHSMMRMICYLLQCSIWTWLQSEFLFSYLAFTLQFAY